MTFDELTDYLQSLPEEIMDAAPDIVAETATEYFKERFTEKSFDGNPWAPAKVPRKNGSLLVDSGNLVNSIRPAYIGRDKVVISAGNDKVDYAQVHNEGYVGPVAVPAHTRRMKEKNIPVKSHTRQANIPQRQFMGHSKELAEKLKIKLKDYTNSLKK